MNLQQLQYFEVLAKEEHYTKASEKLFITQPALSKAIRNLEEEIFIAVPKEHRLAHKEEIKFSEIKDEVFVHYNTSTGMIHSVEEKLNKAGYSTKDLKISFKATEDNAILGLVRAGLGIAFVADAPNVNRKGGTFLKLSDIYVYRPVYMVWRKNNYMSPAVKAFRNYVLNYVTSNRNASL